MTSPGNVPVGSNKDKGPFPELSRMVFVAEVDMA